MLLSAASMPGRSARVGSEGEQGIERALRLLGPLEARVMRIVWSRTAPEAFVVRDIHAQMLELAYTTVMTTVVRLAEKGLLVVEERPRRIGHRYTAIAPDRYLAAASARDADEAIERYGDVALATFAAKLERLTHEQRRRLGELERYQTASGETM